MESRHSGSPDLACGHFVEKSLPGVVAALKISIGGFDRIHWQMEIRRWRLHLCWSTQGFKSRHAAPEIDQGVARRHNDGAGSRGAQVVGCFPATLPGEPSDGKGDHKTTQAGHQQPDADQNTQYPQ